MAKGPKQKLKLLYLKDLLLRETDEEHMLTAQQIMEQLQQLGIETERKTLYDDLSLLEDYGLDIEKVKLGRNTGYHVVSRDFEVAELKPLVDSVQASRFITEKKSANLIKKLESLVSRYEASQLQRQVLISGRSKAMNESIFINVDQLHTAIAENVKISFQYFQWDVHKRAVPKYNGRLYTVSPWELIWDDEKYYLLGYDDASSSMRHYRVDKMLKIHRLQDTRAGQSEFKKINLASYTNTTFGMFGGNSCDVTLRADNALAGVFIDRFGQEIVLMPDDDSHFLLRVSVVPSGQFLGWIFSLGDGVELLGPDSVVADMRAQAEAICSRYHIDRSEKA